jgi:phosphatidate cytidylyltransferase
MLTRIITAAVGLPVFIFVIILGGWPLGLLCMALSLVALYELYFAASRGNIALHWAGYMFTIVYYLLILYWGVGYWLLVTMTLFIITVQTGFALFYRKISLQECITTVYGFFYVSFLFSFIYLIRSHELGQYYVWLIFTSAFGCDTFGYFIGIKFGKHKLTNTPSPIKSVEGLIGGVLGAALLGFLYGYFITRFGANPPPNIIITATVVSFFGAIFSLIGDMSASAVKRHLNIKDFGKWLPGHGGVLDRFDSVLVTAPIVYLVMTVMLRVP